jgi:hypothetical protein
MMILGALICFAAGFFAGLAYFESVANRERKKQ